MKNTNASNPNLCFPRYLEPSLNKFIVFVDNHFKYSFTKTKMNLLELTLQYLSSKIPSIQASYFF